MMHSIPFTTNGSSSSSRKAYLNPHHISTLWQITIDPHYISQHVRNLWHLLLHDIFEPSDMSPLILSVPDAKIKSILLCRQIQPLPKDFINWSHCSTIDVKSTFSTVGTRIKYVKITKYFSLTSTKKTWPTNNYQYAQRSATPAFFYKKRRWWDRAYPRDLALRLLRSKRDIKWDLSTLRWTFGI